ncbi:MAG: response regulator transcription factor [Ignavibacteria bacterium]|nr:response regulator transcription factor [Ignavibacteria bacterium]
MRILIGEDEADIANSLKKNFLDESFEADIALNGEEVLIMINRIKYDLLILDWRMPKYSGIEVCSKLRAHGNNIPILMLTALADINNKVEALNIGADDYLTKPYSFKEVLARINALLRRSNSQVSIQFGSMSLNLPEHKLFINNIEIKLTEKEFDLLKYFISNKGRIIGKEELCNRVWGYNFVPETNIVESAVKNLRKKIEPHCNRSLLKNIYGEGYLLIEN